MENIFKDIVWWAETQTKMPGKEELDDWEFGRERRHAYLKNDQLHNFLRLCLQDEALTIVKISGVARGWELNQDCQVLSFSGGSRHGRLPSTGLARGRCGGHRKVGA